MASRLQEPPLCEVDCVDGKLVCYLRISKPTSKVRVLRGDKHVTAPTKTPLSGDDIIEWQISYWNKQSRELEELGKLLDLAYKNGLVTRDKLENLRSNIEKQSEHFADKYDTTTDSRCFSSKFDDFTVLILKKTVPVLFKIVDEVQIWVEVRHRQTAVGLQPMLYLRIPITQVRPEKADSSPLIGRAAQSKERVIWEPSNSILLEAVRAFSLASTTHKQNMIDILQRVLQEPAG